MQPNYNIVQGCYDRTSLICVNNNLDAPALNGYGIKINVHDDLEDLVQITGFAKIQ